MNNPDGNPFYTGSFNGRAFYDVSAEDRIQRVRTFDLEQCEQALAVEDLQKSVAQALQRRLRQLKTLEQPVADILQGNPLVECCRCRHKHHLEQRNMRAREHRDRCPRCRAETWTRAEEQPDIFAGVAKQ